MSKHFAVDLGAESGRCVAGILENGVMKLEELCRFPTRGLAICGELHWNIYLFYQKIIEGLRAYQSKFGSELDSIGIDSWALDYALLDENGRLMGLPFSYRDDRTLGTGELLEERMGKRKIYELSGTQFLECNTLNQFVGAQRSGDKSHERAKDILFIADALHYMLGAELSTEYTVASITQMVDIHKRAWSAEVAETFCLPLFETKISFAGDKIGCLRDDIADEVGLRRGIDLVAPAVHDTASAVVAIPAQGKDWAYISSGTWSLAGIEIPAPIINDKSFAMNASNSGGILGQTLFLKNIMGLWIIQQCKAQWNQTNPELGYEDIVEMAKRAEPFAAFIDPDDPTFFHPSDMPRAVCDFIARTGQNEVAVDDVATLSRIVYESLALKYRVVFDKIAEVSGKQIRTLHIIGGGSKNALLNQFSANALGVKVLAGPSEGTAMGNLLVQAYGKGWIRDIDEMRGIVKASSELQDYEPQDRDAWEQARERFVHTV